MAPRLASFQDRLTPRLEATRVGLSGDDIAGFSICSDGELEQVYVAPVA